MKDSNNSSKLDAIQKEITQFLKPLGFKKKGRTFNRISEDGITQVINFQMAMSEIGENSAANRILGPPPATGTFTVNLGVLVEELFTLTFPYTSKPFYQEYDCAFRTRLPSLMYGNDKWWLLDPFDQISMEIVYGLDTYGLQWLTKLGTRKSIVRNWQLSKSPRAKLDLGIIMLKESREIGIGIIQEYYDTQDNKVHKQYVFDLSKELGIQLKSH